jgi:triacylglycerol esterase/lipase EstA (alpha/beta hydrolase family)
MSAALVGATLALALGASGASADSSLSNPPPGANNWSCAPSAAHPDPVVLVHGLGATMGDNWFELSPKLAANGYCVFALTYGLDSGETFVGGVEKMEQSAPELAAFVDKVLAATHASKVDIVGHSEGTVMPRYYFKHLGGDAKVNRFVALTPLYQGTTLDGLAGLIAAAEKFPGASGVEALVDRFCGSCQEFLRGSSFLNDLNADGGAVAGVTYTNIMTRYDEAVTPYTSGYLNAPNATNIVLQDQCKLDLAEHAAVAFDPVAAQDVLNALDPAHAKPVPCTLVLPLLGGL